MKANKASPTTTTRTLPLLLIFCNVAIVLYVIVLFFAYNKHTKVRRICVFVRPYGMKSVVWRLKTALSV